MALTAAEKELVLNFLDNLDRAEIQRILANERSFANWLSNSLHSIYVKVKDAIRSMWEWLKGDIFVMDTDKGLTPEERQRILNFLDNMERAEIQRILANERSFANWLSNSLHSIYVKVKDAIRSMWEWLRSRF